MRGFAFIGALAVAASLAMPARAENLDASESARLEAGQTIVREQTFDSSAMGYESERRLVGGLTYTLVDATPDELMTVLEDVGNWKNLLPKTKSATVVESKGLDTFVELAQGASLATAKYTIHLRRAPRDHTVRFWLDPSRPHAIDDAWGFFRAQEAPPSKDGAPRTLLTFGILVDTGPGIVRSFYEERLRSTMMGIPQVVRQYVLANVRRRAIPT
jgi:hypothetical protein